MNRSDHSDMYDPLLEKYKGRFASSSNEEPLTFAESAELFGAYLKLNNRTARIARISDSYQSQLQELKGELKSLNITLMNRVEEETEKRLANERLLARNSRLAAMGEMLGAIAHQWRQPLATLGASIQSITMAFDRQLLDKAFMLKVEKDVRTQLDFMSETIEGFSNFFRPEKEIERFMVVDKIQEVVLLVRSQCADSGITLHIVDNSAMPMEILGYPNEFKQVILNLISNGLDAISERRLKPGNCGIITDHIDEVAISLSTVKNKTVIEVRDTGCGISPEIADRVFEPYFTTKAEGKGTGIGLYMSRLIIEESMGGHLDLSSGPDGTTFKIEL